ncbi:MAG: class I SAM-dependent methyltransferase [Verrucomicrobia bacterium]|nr:class I SAM-dependent methyltransferase [Verrucomicrobiota bacterium]
MSQSFQQESYRSGDYYREEYLSNPMDLAVSTRWMRNYFRVVCRLLPSIRSYRNRRVLEIGSSFGGFVNLLNAEGFQHVTAADLNPLLFPKALSNRFLILDLLSDQLPADAFDLIFAFDVLEHIDDSVRVATNIHRLLSSDGVFVFCVPYPYRKHLLDPYHTNMQYPPYYTNLFRSAGLYLLNMQTSSFIPYIWRFGFPLDVRCGIPSRYFISEVFFVFQKRCKHLHSCSRCQDENLTNSI